MALFTPAKAAEWAGLSLRTMNRLIAEERIPSFKLPAPSARPVRRNRKSQAASVWRRCNSGASHIGRSRGTKTRAVRIPEGVDAPELREARMLLSGG